MADEAARSDKLAPEASGRNAPVAAKKDPDKTTADAVAAPVASKAARKEDPKDADAAREAAAEKESAVPAAEPRSLKRTADGRPMEEGMDSHPLDEEERAKLDKRLQLAEDGKRIEQRPLTHPGLKTAQPDHTEYSVERELREQWPLAYSEDDPEGRSAESA